jgi:hypothetical protein
LIIDIEGRLHTHDASSIRSTFPRKAVKFCDAGAVDGLTGNRFPSDNLPAMYYFFRRGGASIRCEVRTDSCEQGYDLIVDRPDAMVSVEHFDAPPDLNRRWSEIERTLLREGWSGPQLRT